MKILWFKKSATLLLIFASMWFINQNKAMNEWPATTPMQIEVAMTPVAHALSVAKQLALPIEYEKNNEDTLESTQPVSVEAFNQWIEDVSIFNLEPVSITIIPSDDYGKIMLNEVRF